jgi:hypothetical protein
MKTATTAPSTSARMIEFNIARRPALPIRVSSGLDFNTRQRRDWNGGGRTKLLHRWLAATFSVSARSTGRDGARLARVRSGQLPALV